MKNKLIYISTFLFLAFGSIFLQNIANAQSSDEEKQLLEEYQAEAQQMISFLQYTMNVLGDPLYSAKEKDVVINESYTKIFADDKVQIEDDLDDNRDVVTNKDVQAYLKDVDFFFKQVRFEFNIIDIDHSSNHEGKLFFTVKMMRTLEGTTVDNEEIKSDKERYVEINVDEENKDLKIASIYTTKLSRDEELTYWWAGLTEGWRTILGLEIEIKEGLRLNEIQAFSDSTYMVDGQEIMDSVAIIKYVREAADREVLDLSNSHIVPDLRPLSQLKKLQTLDISHSSITDIFPIRNITSLTYLNCSNTVIDDLSPLKYSKSLKTLILNSTPVTSIVVIENFDNLEALHIQQTVIDSLPSMDRLSSLKELNCSSTNLRSLDSLVFLTSLQSINLSNTSVDDLGPISSLDSLQKIDLSHTRISEIGKLAELPLLQSIDVSHTPVADIAMLTELESLKLINADNSGINMAQFTDFANTRPDVDVVFASEEIRSAWGSFDDNWVQIVRDKLNFKDSISNIELHRILKITDIDISGNSSIVSLAPLEWIPLLKKLDFSNTSITEIDVLKNNINLTHIYGSNSQVVDVNALSSHDKLQVVNFSNTEVNDISFVSGLDDLDSLFFNDTKVNDISALNDVESFKIAYFEHTPIDDKIANKLSYDENTSLVIYKSEKLRTWWGNMEDKWQDFFVKRNNLPDRPSTEQLHQIAASKKITIQSISIKSINPVAELVRLESLLFAETRVNSLAPLTNLESIRELKCPRNPISDISPLSSLTSLEILDMDNTQVSSLKPISGLSNLKSLTFSGTNVKDLSPIGSLQILENLDFSKTKVKQIKALKSLQNLKTVNCYNNKISPKKIEGFRNSHPDCEVVYY